MNDDKIKEIVSQLQRLQKGRPNVVSNASTTRATIPVEATTTKSFVIGDRVRVLNQGILQKGTGNRLSQNMIDDCSLASAWINIQQQHQGAISPSTGGHIGA
jgi:hypothetical protein